MRISDWSSDVCSSDLKLSALELEQYNILLEEQAEPFDEKAIKTYENNLRRISQGVYDQWIAKSAAQLAVMAPAQYAKREKGQDRYESQIGRGSCRARVWQNG